MAHSNGETETIGWAVPCPATQSLLGVENCPRCPFCIQVMAQKAGDQGQEAGTGELQGYLVQCKYPRAIQAGRVERVLAFPAWTEPKTKEI